MALLVLLTLPAHAHAHVEPDAQTGRGVQPPASTTSVRALLQEARRGEEAGDLRAALESLRKARAIAPDSEDVLGAFAQVALAARMLLPAIATLDALTRICPTVARYHHMMGVALTQAGDMPAAVESLQRANRLEPEQPATLLALGLALNGRTRYAEAKTALLTSLELDPANIDGLAALAEAEAGAGEWRQAEEHARRVLTAAAAHATGHLVMGMVLMQRARYADARDALEHAISADPASPAGHYQLSLAYARLGDEAASRTQVELYRQKLRETETRIEAARALRTTTGERQP